MTFDEARAQFPVLERYAYLNAGSNGPLARATIDAFVEQAQSDLRDGRSGTPYFERMLALRDEVRAGFAAVIGVAPMSIALVESTTRGCAIVLAGFGLTGEDEVITTDQEHFGLTGPLYATGARIVITVADEDAMFAAITPRTRLIATSHVLWTTGQRLDVARLKRESGLPMLIDGAQSAGAIPVDVGEIDFYTVSAQKWLCAPDPTGALYVRDPTLLRVKTPSYFAQDSYEVSGAFVPKQSAARFDSGWISVPGLAATVAALGTHPDWRYERSAIAAARCAELLAPHVEVITPPGHSTLVSFRPTSDPTALVTALAQEGVIVRELPGRNIVRASCGWWTSDDDLARLAASVGD
ncbi:MAG TPA: aminotransferase class V-fold PLP-dependent enzyme [Gaiellaceae bacterium]|nr:aminotransferase class V-fold PLP-dependent enzyme [Gaiellaceae bacterium]